MMFSLRLIFCCLSKVSLLGATLWLGSVFLPFVALAQTVTPRPDFALESTITEETEYTIGPGDRIRVNVFQVPDLSAEYLVLVDGTVTFPLIGSVRVKGYTTTQLGELLTQKYAAFIKRPLVTVGLIAPRPLRIAIAGEVNSPGSYTLEIEAGQKFPSLTDILEQAGGLTATADVSQVQVRRTVQGRTQVVNLDLWQLFYKGDQGQNITLRDGDSILVPSADAIDPYSVYQLVDASFGINANTEIDVAVVGEVVRPGTYKLLPERLSGVSNTGPARRQPPTITQAITIAGGIKPLADIRNVKLRRFTRLGELQTIDVDLWTLLQEGGIEQDLVLREGDTIIIPTANNLPSEESQALAQASFAPETIRVTVVGEVVSPGARQLPPNIPLNQALSASGSFDKRRADEAVVELIRLNPNGTVTKREIPVDFSKGVGDEDNPALRDKDVIVVRRNGLTVATDFLSTLFSPLSAILSPAARVTGFINVFDD